MAFLKAPLLEVRWLFTRITVMLILMLLTSLDVWLVHVPIHSFTGGSAFDLLAASPPVGRWSRI